MDGIHGICIKQEPLAQPVETVVSWTQNDQLPLEHRPFGDFLVEERLMFKSETTNDSLLVPVDITSRKQDSPAHSNNISGQIDTGISMIKSEPFTEGPVTSCSGPGQVQEQGVSVLDERPIPLLLYTNNIMLGLGPEFIQQQPECNNIEAVPDDKPVQTKPVQSKWSGKQRYQCTLCCCSFKHISDLKIHEKTHTGEKPYICSYCPFTAARKHHIRAHERYHTWEKPYKCSVCQYASTSRECLYQHEITHLERDGDTVSKDNPGSEQNTHVGDKPFKCSLCQFATTSKSDLELHQLVHTPDPEEPYKCSLCSFISSTKQHLSRHENRCHPGERLHKCSVCPYSSAQLSALETHQKKYHGRHANVKRYKCPDCDFTSRGQGTLKLHGRTTHGKKTY